MWLYILGIFTHLIFFISVFDTYFQSPIIHGMLPEVVGEEPAAKRLVLFVADGLRADSIFGLANETTRAPYLRNIIENRGTWGVSHTRMPTESRPGHAAIIGGIYEDPSAVTKGWKENPVEFDSVFNQSQHTWSWGSPDILPMFAAGSKRGHVDTYMYTSEEEDYASNDASKLDTWVFNKVEEFFLKSKNDKKLTNQLSENGNVFFLHLLGIDINGHANKPHSVEYQNNIEYVDKGISHMVDVFENFFKDNSTAYIFTSDHGMTDWGSHGAGDPSETETPLIAWGSGISFPEDPSNFRDKMLYDPRIETWGLNHVRRHDIFQADLAPLMSSVIGIPIPVNSMGVLPVEYLYPSAVYRAKSIFANARQMVAHYRQRRIQKAQKTLSILFKPFPELPPDKEIDMLRQIRKSISLKDFDEAIAVSNRLISLSLLGIEYFVGYDRPLLIFLITLGYIAWLLLLICQILKDHTNVSHIAENTVEGRRVKRKNHIIEAFIIGWGFASVAFLIAVDSPWSYYLYFLTPVYLWWVTYQRLEFLHYTWLIISSFNMIWEVAIRLLVVAVGIEILIFSFFIRPLLSIGLIFIGLWPFVLYSLQGTTEKSLRICWFGSCILLASFTYLPVVGKYAIYPLVEAAGIIAFILFAIGLICCGGEGWMIRSIPPIVFVQGGMILSSVYLKHTTAFSIEIKEGLPLGNQFASWAILIMSFISPLMASNVMMGRLVSVSASLLCPFLLLSIRHEAFFYISLGIAMFLWLILEYYLTTTGVQLSNLKFTLWERSPPGRLERHLVWSDIRRAFFFLFFIILAFFGIGNVASINSFDVSYVYCFVTVFSPFVMGGLLLFKIVIPFLLVTCFFRAICSILEVPAKALFLVFLVLSDIMAAQFFFFIRVDGSWLDIGTSISHYVICMGMTFFVMILSQLADFLTTFNLFNRKQIQVEVLPRVKRGLHRD